jgi:aldehyde dehydrogenase (NAD+)
MISDDPTQIKAVFDKSKAAFSTHKTFDMDFREAQLKSLIKGFTEYQEKLNDALKKDLGHNDFNCFYLSTGITMQELNHTLEGFRKWAATKEVDVPMNVAPGRSYLVQEPYGSVLIIGPWNYPYYCTLPYVATAIAAGNTVVLKPSEMAANSSNVLKELFDKYLDKDCYQIIEGGFKVASEIITLPWDFVVFTGGTDKGKKVAQACAANLVPYVLELGGKCPAYVDKDSDLESAALRLIHTRMVNWGQTCVSPDYVLAHKDIKEELLKKMKDAFIQFFGEDPSKSKDRLKIINETHVKRLESYLAEDHGGKVVYIGGDGKVNLAERYVPPAIIDTPKLTSSLMKEEIFGPIICVQDVAGIDEAVKFINERPKPLALYYFGKTEGENKEKILNKTSSGGVTINDCCFHVFSPDLPFGGVGFSGNGAVHGEIGFQQLSHMKPVLERETINTYPFNLRFPPYAVDIVPQFLAALAGAPPKAV